MRKAIKIFLSFISSIVLIIIVIPVVASILLSSYHIQNYVAGKVTDHFSEKLGTTVTLDHIGIKLFNRVTVTGFYVEDLQGDTLLYVKHLDVGFRGYNPWTGVFRMGDIEIEGADFRIAQDSTGTTNLKYITQQLRRQNPPERPASFIMRANRLTVDSTRFRLQRYVIPDREGGINFADMDVRDISLDIERISLVDDSIEARIKHISAIEKSGFDLREFSGDDVRVWSQGIRMKNFHMKDALSELFMDELTFDYPRWNAFNNYVEEVHMHVTPKNSRIAFRTIGWFAPRLAAWKSIVRFDGTISGTVSDMSGRLNKAVINDTELDARFSIVGLTDIAKTRFTIDVNELSTHVGDAAVILQDITGKEWGKVAQTLSRLDRVRVFGRFDGLLTDFLVDGNLLSTHGGADFNVRMNPEENGRTHLDGKVSLQNFALGDLLAVNKLGAVTLDANLNGFMGTDTLRLEADAKIGHLYYSGYNYQEINIDGEIRNNYYKGFVGSGDPNIDFKLEGTFDFNTEIPEYDFSLVLNRLDLHALGLNRRDSVSVLSAGMRIKAQGTTLDDITGNGTISDLVYIFPGDTLRSETITLFGDNLSEQKSIRFNSDFLDAELTSRLNVIDLIPYARNTVRYYLPSIDSVGMAPLSPHLQAALDSTRRNSANNYYGFKMEVKENGDFASALLPGLFVSPGTKMSLLFNPAVPNFSLKLDSELVEYKNIYIAHLDLTNRNQADSIAFYLRTEEVGIGNFFMPELTVHGGVRDNLVNLSTGFTNNLNGMSAMINTVSRLLPDTVSHKAEWHTRFTASRIRIGEQEWRITSPAIIWGGDNIDVHQFRMLSTGQDFLLDGRVSNLPTDTLHLSMNNFDLSPLSGLIDRYGYKVTGRTNGHADLIAGRGDALFYGRIGFNDVQVNEKPLQNSTFISEWDTEDNRIRMSLILESRDTVMRGGYRPGDKRYYVNAHLPDIDLALLSPVLNGVLTDIEGTAHADVVLRGTGGTPSLNGKITVPDFAGTVDFTRVRYHLNDAEIDVVDNSLILPKTPIYDAEGGTGEVELALRTRYFSQLSYDVRVTARRMLGINTTLQDNDYFYGKAYASGTVAIKGDRRRVNMDMNITTEDNSAFFLPLTGASSIAEADFIVFEDPNRKIDFESLSRYQLIQMMRDRRRNGGGQSDLNINMQINVRPNTEVQLVIDPKIGDIIKGNGTGTLNLHVRPREDLFTMSGDFQINEGSYLFTLMNILNKRFTIERGSYIQWTGDPLDAILNVTANYRVRASASPLTGNNQIIPVDCKIMLSDRLSQPTINFDISFPTIDAETRTTLQNAMATQEQKSQQFVWLLMTNGFYADTNQGSSSNIGTATTTVTGFDFLSNQLSNMFSTQRFSFNFGYTPKSDMSSDEFEGMFSSELIPNKLILEGEVNYNLDNNDADPRDNQFSGDFYLTYIIDRVGNLRTKVFSRTINRYDENQGLQENGVGLYYKKDFDHWSDLFRRWRRQQAMQPENLPKPEDESTPAAEETESQDVSLISFEP